MKLKTLVAGIVLAVLHHGAMAENTGLYVDFKTGSVNHKYSNITNNNQSGYGFSVGFGNEVYSLEAEVVNLGGFESISRFWTGRSIGINVVGNAPLNQNVKFYGKIGVAQTTLDSIMKPGYTAGYSLTIQNTGATFGFGLKYEEPKYAIHAGLDTYPIGDSNTGTTSAVMPSIGGTLKF